MTEQNTASLTAQDASVNETLVAVQDSSSELYTSVQTHFANQLAIHGPELFVGRGRNRATDIFLSGLDMNLRSEYKCQTCAQFFERASTLVFIGEDGRAWSALWNRDLVPERYKVSVAHLNDLAEETYIENVFRPKDFDQYTKTGLLQERFRGFFGALEKGGFPHFHLAIPKEVQDRAANYAGHPLTRVELLKKNINLINANTLRTVIALFDTDKLMRKEKYRAWAEWLLKVKEFKLRNKFATEKHYHNFMFREATMAPAGWVEFRESMLGTLLDQIDSFTATEAIISRFNHLVDPERYMRATVEAKEGNIKAANKKMEELCLTPALPRRWARQSEVAPFAKWVQPEVQEAIEEATTSKSGAFDKLLKKAKPDTELTRKLPSTTIPLFRFMRDVLPKAERIEMNLGHLVKVGSWTTAVNADAPPIVKWDRPDLRNPFISFHLSQAVQPSVIGFAMFEWVNVRMIMGIAEFLTKPAEERAKENNLQFVLEGAKPFPMVGCALFKEALIGALHEFGPTIEQFSNSTPLEEIDDAEKAICAGIYNGLTLRVTSNKVPTVYVIQGLDM